jgi:hypothetical protein
VRRVDAPRQSVTWVIQCLVAITAVAVLTGAEAKQVYERRMGDWSVSCQVEEYGFQGCEAQRVYNAHDLNGRLRMASDHIVLGILMNEHSGHFEVRFKAPGWRYRKGDVHYISIVFDGVISWDLPMDTVEDGKAVFLRYSGLPDSEGALPGGFMSAYAFELIIDGLSIGSFPLTGSHSAISHAAEMTEQFAGRTS